MRLQVSFIWNGIQQDPVIPQVTGFTTRFHKSLTDSWLLSKWFPVCMKVDDAHFIHKHTPTGSSVTFKYVTFLKWLALVYSCLKYFSLPTPPPALVPFHSSSQHYHRWCCFCDWWRKNKGNELRHQQQHQHDDSRVGQPGQCQTEKRTCRQVCICVFF